MTELDTGEHTAQSGTPPQSGTDSRAHSDRRNFMRRVFFASGATAVATMGGAGAWTALATSSPPLRRRKPDFSPSPPPWPVPRVDGAGR
ncbi:Tat pathway signal protein, partial [Streptomyces mirabilis]